MLRQTLLVSPRAVRVPPVYQYFLSKMRFSEAKSGQEDTPSKTNQKKQSIHLLPEISRDPKDFTQYDNRPDDRRRNVKRVRKNKHVPPSLIAIANNQKSKPDKSSHLGKPQKMICAPALNPSILTNGRSVQSNFLASGPFNSVIPKQSALTTTLTKLGAYTKPLAKNIKNKEVAGTVLDESGRDSFELKEKFRTVLGTSVVDATPAQATVGSTSDAVLSSSESHLEDVQMPKSGSEELNNGLSSLNHRLPQKLDSDTSKVSPLPKVKVKTAKKRCTNVTKCDKPKLKIVRESFDESRRHRIYAFGFSETGALGLHKPWKGRRFRRFFGRPMRHEFAEETEVISAECGYGFTLFYVKSEDHIKLYGCGLNTDYQIGPTDQELLTYPVPIDIHIKSPKTKIVSFSGGRAHSAIATDVEGVFLLGSNCYGQCGRAVENETKSEVCVITQIKSFGNEKAVEVVCGQDHTLFVTKSGKVYSCGWGEDGQTGLGHTSQVSKPSLVLGDIENESIVKVTGRSDTVLALNDKGELFGWGNNEFRQIVNHRDLPQVDTPLQMTAVNKMCGKIVDMAAGNSFCIVLNEDGDVFVWGQGILGGGPLLSQTAVPTLLPRTLFGLNDYQPNAIVVKVYCGLDHLMAVNSLKHAYSWGKCKWGCIGIGRSRDQYFPYKLALGANALYASCGVDHSILVTDHLEV